MVVFGLQLKPQSEELIEPTHIASFDPDLSSLVQFKGGRQEYMRSKTQILILQNYELIKQRMLTGGSGDLLT